MRVYLGSDHAGFELKNHLVEWLKEAGHEPVDCGPHIYDAQDDYPPFCLRAAERTAADPEALGIVIGGSGNGEQIAANKVKGVRAALAWSEETASLGRQHNNANVWLSARGCTRRRRRRSSSRPSWVRRSPRTRGTFGGSTC
jgi:ribose 5-phosphate isomerase B